MPLPPFRRRYAAAAIITVLTAMLPAAMLLPSVIAEVI